MSAWKLFAKRKLSHMRVDHYAISATTVKIHVCMTIFYSSFTLFLLHMFYIARSQKKETTAL